MKKSILLMMVIAAVFACSRKSVPATTSTPNQNTATAETKQVAEPPKEDVAKADLELKGSQIYTTKCTRCHGAKPVENYTTTAWSGILKSMIPKARLTEDESLQVTTYVMAHAKK